MTRLLNGFPALSGGLGYQSAVASAATGALEFAFQYKSMLDWRFKLPPGPEAGPYAGKNSPADEQFFDDVEDWKQKQKKKQTFADKQLKKALKSFAAAKALPHILSLAKGALKKTNAITTAIDLASWLYDQFGSPEAELPAAMRPHEVWPGRPGWTKATNECVPVDPISPFHYPLGGFTTCISLISQPVSNRNLYGLQGSGGSQIRVLRLLRNCSVGKPNCSPSLPVCDQGNNYQSYFILESTFQTDPNFYRRRGSEFQQSPAVDGSGYAPSIHPNAAPSVLAPAPIMKPLPWPFQGLKQANVWPEGYQVGYASPASEAGARTRVRGRVAAATVDGRVRQVVATIVDAAAGSRPIAPPPVGGGPAVPATQVAYPGGQWTNKPHWKKPPGPRAKEAKFRGAVEKILYGIMSGLTEYGDFLEAVKKSLPRSSNKKCGNDILCLAGEIYKNWSPELAASLLGNLAYNAVEDMIVGKTIAKANKIGKPYQNPWTGARQVTSKGGAQKIAQSYLGKVNPQ